jgi:hypothetical protein
MVKFRYMGDSTEVSVGIAGARFRRGVVNEVPDERLAAHLRTVPGFEEVTADMLPPVTSAILHSPQRQGQTYGDPTIDALVQERLREDKVKRLEHEGTDGLGNINRADQYAANVEALSGQEGGVTETGSDSGGEEVASPPASKPAGKTKASKTET